MVLGDTPRRDRRGQPVKGDGRIFSITVGDACWAGRKRPRPPSRKGDIVAHRPSCRVQALHRAASTSTSVQTGIKAIEEMTPIARSRQLIIGERKTGKTPVAVDAIITNTVFGVKCIYVASVRGIDGCPDREDAASARRDGIHRCRRRTSVGPGRSSTSRRSRCALGQHGWRR